MSVGLRIFPLRRRNQTRISLRPYLPHRSAPLESNWRRGGCADKSLIVSSCACVLLTCSPFIFFHYCCLTTWKITPKTNPYKTYVQHNILPYIHHLPHRSIDLEANILSGCISFSLWTIRMNHPFPYELNKFNSEKKNHQFVNTMKPHYKEGDKAIKRKASREIWHRL